MSCFKKSELLSWYIHRRQVNQLLLHLFHICFWFVIRYSNFKMFTGHLLASSRCFFVIFMYSIVVSDRFSCIGANNKCIMQIGGGGIGMGRCYFKTASRSL